MNKALQINLGGIPFNIDEDAYKRLDQYLQQLERHFRKSESQEEILTDIEARLAELIDEKMHDRRIVEMPDIDESIRIMGTPQDFDDAEPAWAKDSASQTSSRTWDIKTGKRLFRDPENIAIGGVCSGLAAFLGIHDVLWVRLGFVLFFATGAGFITYIIMWAIVPEARSAADRLAMMGEPANAQNIANMVENSIEDISDKIKDNWEEIKSKKKSDKSTRNMRGSNKKRFHVLMILALPFLLIKAIFRIARRVLRRLSRFRRHGYARGQYV